MFLRTALFAAKMSIKTGRGLPAAFPHRRVIPPPSVIVGSCPPQLAKPAEAGLPPLDIALQSALFPLFFALFFSLFPIVLAPAAFPSLFQGLAL
jgi:hypothetical protein